MTVRAPLAGHLAMFAFSGLVAFSYTFGALVAKDIDPTVLTALRFVIALIAMSVLAAVTGRNLRFLLRNSWAFVLIGALMACYFITMFEALARTTPISTSAVFTLAPLFAAALGWIILRLPTDRPTLFAVLLGAIGALWVIFRGDPVRLIQFKLGYGEVLYLFGTIAHAAVPSVTRRLIPDVGSFQAATGTVFGALLVTVIYAFPDILGTNFTALPTRVWLVALYLGVVTTAFTFFLLQVAIPRLPPGKVMAYTYLVPSWVALHALAGGDSFPRALYPGIALTLLALALLLARDVRSP